MIDKELQKTLTENGYNQITLESIESEGYTVSKGERSKRNGVMNKLKKQFFWGFIYPIWFGHSLHSLMCPIHSL